MSERKVALITAGGSGMGAAAARRLAADGYTVAILSSSGKGEALAAELGGLGVTGSNLDADDIKRFVDLSLTRFGRVDVLVNSAGHGPKGPVLDISDADWHLGMDYYLLNVTACHTAHAGTGRRGDHQHLDRLGLRARRSVSHLWGLPRGPRRLYQALCRQVCG